MANAYQNLAPVYDAFMADIDFDAWAAYLIALIRSMVTEEAPRVVDCGCGTGALMLRLLKAGLPVIGLDRSPDMLQVAAEKLRRAGFAKAELVCEDMCQLVLHRPVDVIVSACDGVNYLLTDEDVLRFFRSAYAALKPGGLFLFDISSAYKLGVLLDGRCFGEVLMDHAYLCSNCFDAGSAQLQMDLTIFSRESDGRYVRAEETHFQRAYQEETLVKYLGDTGFTAVEAYAAFTGDRPDPASERIQFASRRPRHG